MMRGFRADAALLLVLALTTPAIAAGQGLTTGAIQGTLTPAPGSTLTLLGATVTVTNQATGHRWRAAADDSGRYFVENLPVGGRYRLRVAAPGYEPAERSGIRVNLGERVTADFTVIPSVFQIEGVTVTAAQDPRLNANRTGPAQTIDRATIEGLPVLNRDVLDLALESPLVSREVFGLSIAGQDPRSTSLRIDGGVNDNLFGRFSATPGGLLNLLPAPVGGGVRPIPLDAVQELQVSASPFDVRLSGFGGGVINAVTRSGTNDVQGSLFITFQDDALVGEDVAGAPGPDFRTLQGGGSVAGPLVRDRLHAFLAVDLQAGDLPYAGPRIGADTTGGADSAGVGLRRASLLRFQRILSERYRVEAGDFGPIDVRNPAGNVFGKLSAQLDTNSVIEVSQSWSHGALKEAFLDREAYGTWDFSSAGLRHNATTLATRANWNAVLGRFSNELILARLHIDDSCRPGADFPVVKVDADRGAFLAGNKFSCSPSSLDQRVLELTDNLTFGIGSQRLTAGVHVESLDFEVRGAANSAGAWTFESLDSLERGLANSYRRTISGLDRREGPGFDLAVRQVGVYVQDQWEPLGHVTLTAGLRLDVPFFSGRPNRNPAVLEELGYDTSVVPDGKATWSPRLGVNWDVGGAGVTSLRGGAGLFTGRPVWFLAAEAYHSTGLEELTLTCEGEETPPFTIDPSRQPDACRTTGAIPVPQVAFFDPNFRFPQALKAAAGVDHRLPGSLIATVDLLYTRAVHELFFQDVNLLPAGETARGEGGRLLYGALDPETADATPRRRSAAFGPVVRETNRDGDWALAASAQLQGRVGSRLDLNASYTWTRARSLQTLSGLGLDFTGLGVAAAQIAGTPLDGTLENPALRPSLTDAPHRVHVSGLVRLPHDVTLGLIYEGASGSPYTWVVEGDANADGFGEPFFTVANNDPVYVPERSAPGGDVSLVVPDPETGAWVPAPASEYGRLESIIRRESCLQRHRGGILRRNSCRDPWQRVLNLRASKRFRLGTGPAVEITADVFNVSNLLDRDAGLVRRTAPFGGENLGLLGLRGWDPERGRGIYELVAPEPRGIDVDASRWRAQLGMRYVF